MCSTQLRITQCHDPKMWYADLVNTLVPFCGQDGKGFWSREPAGFINTIPLSDAVIVRCEDGQC